MKPKSNQLPRLIDGVILKTTKNRIMNNSARKGMRKLVGTLVNSWDYQQNEAAYYL